MNRDLVMTAIMQRYGGLVNLIDDLREDADTVYVNIQDDIMQKGETLELDEIEEEIQAIVR